MKKLPLAKKYNIYQMSGDPQGQDAFSHDEKRVVSESTVQVYVQVAVVQVAVVQVAVVQVAA